MNQLGQDFRYALRMLAKHRAFTLTAVLTLALGMGVNGALFTLFNAVALRSLPVDEPDQIVVFRRPGTKSNLRFSYSDYQQYRDQVGAFQDVVAWFEAPMVWDDPASVPDILLSAEGRSGLPGGVFVQFVSANYFPALGAEMTLGRGFRPDENAAPQSGPVIVLSHLFWERQLNRDPGVIGSTLSFSGMKLTVIGVAGPGFVGHQPAPPAGWVPFMMAMTPAALGQRSTAPFALFARLGPGRTLEQAQAELSIVAERAAVPGSFAAGRFQPPALDPGLRFVNLQLNRKTAAIMAPIIVGFLMVLAIACTNVANLLFARGLARQQEIGVRLALGASRGRIIRQLLTENLLLSLLGAAGGTLVAHWTVATILRQLPATWGRVAEMRQWRFLDAGLDHRVLGFAFVLVLVTTVAAGLAPALHASAANLLSALKGEPSVFGLRLSQSSLRRLLVVFQIAVCLALLSCAGLLGRNLAALRGANPGFEPRAVRQALAEPLARPADAIELAAAVRRSRAAIRDLPAVTAACEVGTAPMLGHAGQPKVTVTARDRGPDAPTLQVRLAVVSPEFFETFGIEFVRGRAFARGEADAMEPGVVLTESAARRIFGEIEVVGRLLTVEAAAFRADGRARGERSGVVVGIIRDLRSTVTDARGDFLVLPLGSDYGTSGHFYVRLREDTAATLAALRRDAAAQGIVFSPQETVAARLEAQYAPFVVLAWLGGVLGVLALLMATIGLYGLNAFFVSQREREISIRLAIGATVHGIVRLCVWQGLRLVAVGVAAGLLGGAMFALVLRRMLFGLEQAFDPLAFGGMTLLLAVTATLACWLPARRATKVDPMVALRAE